MNYKLYIYVVCIFLSAFALSGINFTNFFKKGKLIEARIFVVLLSLALGYLVGDLVIAFLIK